MSSEHDVSGSRRGPSPAIWALACAAPALVFVSGYFTASYFAEGDAAIRRIQVGVAVGAVLGLLVSFGNAAWMLRACKRGGSSFLAPMAFGFLGKLVLLAAGTLLFWKPLAEQGHHLAFALAFVSAAFAFQLVITPSVAGATKNPASTTTG